jgi:hypothetical protein
MKVKADLLLKVYDKKKVMGYYQYNNLEKCFYFTFDNSYKQGRNKKIEEIFSAADKIGVNVKIKMKLFLNLKKKELSNNYGIKTKIHVKGLKKIKNRGKKK